MATGNKPRTERGEALPAWLANLARELGDGGSRAPPDVLTPLAALDELRVTCDSIIAGQSDPNKPDRTSLAADLGLALGEMGGQLNAAVQANLRAFQKDDLSQLFDLLADVEGARRLRVALDVLASKLLTDVALAAAWADVLAAFEELANPDLCELRIAQLKTLIERRGHDWDERNRQLTGILGDDLFAAIRSGLVDEPKSWDEVDPRERAGLSIERRLQGCHAVIVEQAREGEVKVWFAFAQAHLPYGYMRKGPVQFFETRLWPDVIKGQPQFTLSNFERPDELDDRFADLHLKGVPDENGVLARVALPKGPIAGARDRAEHLLRGLLEAAWPDSPWQLMEGSSAVSEQTGWFGSMGFDEPGEYERARSYVPPHDDPTAERLGDLDDGFATALTARDEVAEDVIRELRWELAAREADPPQRLALRMRTLERSLPIPREARGAVPEAARRYLREIWANRYLRDELQRLAFDVRRVRGIDENNRQRVEEINAKLITPGNGLEIITDLGQVMVNAPELANLLPEESMAGRLARDLSNSLASSKAMLDRLARFDRMFDRLVARTVRQRNSVLHGAGTVEAVVESCQNFLRRLTTWTIFGAIDAAGKGIDPLRQLEETRSKRLAERARLEAGETPAGVLFQERGASG